MKSFRYLSDIVISFCIHVYKYLVLSDIMRSYFVLTLPKKLSSHRNQTQPPVRRLAGTLATATAAAFAGFAEQIQQLSGRQHRVDLESQSKRASSSSLATGNLEKKNITKKPFVNNGSFESFPQKIAEITKQARQFT